MGESKTYAQVVDQIIAFNPKMEKDRKRFSDYVIHKIIGDFLRDHVTRNGVVTEEVRDKGKQLYIDIMNAWEKRFEQAVKESKDEQERTA